MKTIIQVAFLRHSHGFPVQTAADINEPVLVASVIDPNNQRSLWDILKSSFATLFACIWLSIHPNVPAPSDGEWKIRQRRLTTMLCALLVPELVFVWALRQRWAAMNIARRYKEWILDESDRGWTRRHGFFTAMGGFSLCKEKPIPLDIDQISRLALVNAMIEWPDISDEEIQDKSKGDFLAKFVAVLQTSWFVLHCAARFAQGLAVTELELVTMAFAVLNVALYWAWADKPLDVRCGVYVKFTPATTLADVEAVLYGDVQTSDGRDADDAASEQILEDDDSTLAVSSSVLTEVKSRSSLSFHVKTKRTAFPTSHIDVVFKVCGKCCSFLLSAKSISRALIGGLIWLARPFNDMLTAREIRPNARRVPTLYAPSSHDERDPDGGGNLIGLGLLIAIVFGSIHCVAWNFDFPTHQERNVWRVAAVIIAAAPLPFQLLGKLILGKGPQSTMFMYSSATVWYLILMMYITARLTLLVLPLLALRDLPATAYEDISWVQYIPHI